MDTRRLTPALTGQRVVRHLSLSRLDHAVQS
jgi:hypothetical protein